MDKEKETHSKKKKKWVIYVVAAIALVIIILLLLHCCGNSKRRKIVLHYGDEVIEVDTNFKLSDLDVEGGKISFLVDSDGYIVEPNAKLDSKKEYSAHIIPDGKESVKVTYKIDKDKYTVDYQKGSGLLLPKDPDKKGYIFTGWVFEGKEGTPYYMMPVNEDMTIVAVFGKSDKKDGKCTLNCDTNKDGSCDYNCDTNNDGKPDTNIDTDGDGKPDLNVDPDHDGKCNVNCDTNGDGTPDINIDTDGDGICDQNCDENGVLGERNYNNNYRYTCNGKDSAYAVISAKSKFISFVLDGKSIPESEFNAELIDGSRAYWFDYLIGSGKKVNYEFKTIAVDDKNQKYYFTKKGTISFEGDCDKKSDVINVEYSSNSVEKCGEYSSNRSAPIENLTSEGLVVNDGSTFKLLKSSIDGNPDGIEVKCEMGKNGIRFDFYASHGKNLHEFIDSIREGKVVITCVYEVVTDGQKYNFTGIFATTYKACSNENSKTTYKLTYNANGGNVSPSSKTLKEGEKYGTLPTPTRSDYTFDGWYTKASGGNKVSSSTTIKSNTTIYAHWKKNETPKQDNPTPTAPKQETPTPTAPVEDKDNGTISLSAAKSCLIGSESTTVTATVSYAKDSNVNWNESDSCLTINGSGNSKTVSANNCNGDAKVVAKLSNGSKDEITIKHERVLEVTLYDTVAGYDHYEGVSEGSYSVGKASIRANQKVTFSVIKASDHAINSQSDARLDFNIGGTGTIDVKTSCGQQKTFTIIKAIN